MNLCMRLLKKINNKYNEDDLIKPAIILSPHFDDETLGCGGTIIQKRKNGADVKIVFMTDGSKSHKHLIAEDKLKEIRKRESIAASCLLGLNEKDLFFLDFEETKLSENINSAVNEVTEIFLNQKPEEIFIPYHNEPHLWSLDHLSTNKIAMLALYKCEKKPKVYEYPIWLWYYHPYLNSLMGSPKRLNTLKQNVASRFSLYKNFRCFVYIGDVLHLKRAALSQYTSQMTRLIPDPRWQTLGSISKGKFLKCFFQEYEIFATH